MAVTGSIVRTQQSPVVRIALIGVSVLFLSAILIMPVVSVLVYAFSEGMAVYLDALRANLKSDVRVEIARAQLPPETVGEFAQIEVAYRAAVIAPEQLYFYFDRFYRTEANADPAKSTVNESALGMAIAKLLANAHGGTISITSDNRSGTQIKFTLPLLDEA